MPEESFHKIHAALNGTPSRRRGWYDADCPNCGKEAARGQTHFGYSEEGMAHCFVCGWSGGWHKLAELIRLDFGDYVPPAPAPRPAPTLARWRLNPHELLRRYQSHPEKVRRWQEYKPLSQATIEKHHFGFGPLPFVDDSGDWYMSKSNWLIVPVYHDGALIALRGRNITDSGPKWISATGSKYALWNVDNVQAGKVVWLVENYVDAAWLMQARPNYDAVAIGGATTWQDEWALQLIKRQPRAVMVALDNDLVGNGGGANRETLIAEWQDSHPGLAVPSANGPRIVNEFLRLKVPASLFKWPNEAPAKAGIDWILEE